MAFYKEQLSLLYQLLTEIRDSCGFGFHNQFSAMRVFQRTFTSLLLLLVYQHCHAYIFSVSGNVQPSQEAQQVQIATAGLPAGLYLLRLSDGSGQQTLKLVRE